LNDEIAAVFPRDGNRLVQIEEVYPALAKLGQYLGCPMPPLKTNND